VCALGDFLVLSAPVLRQIARYLPHHTNENASKTHPKSAHDKFKTASKMRKSFVMLNAHFQWKLHSIMTIHQEFFRKSILLYYNPRLALLILNIRKHPM